MIETARMLLGRWTMDDLDDACRLWGDAKVMTLLGGPLSRAQVTERLTREIGWQEKHGYQYWKAVDKTSFEFIGCCGLKPNDWEGADIIETGFHLLPARWGGGYATEAAGAAIGFAFARLDAHRVFSGHHPDNSGSRRVLEKLGFKQVGSRFYEPTGLVHPWYELRRDLFAGVSVPL